MTGVPANHDNHKKTPEAESASKSTLPPDNESDHLTRLRERAKQVAYLDAKSRGRMTAIVQGVLEGNATYLNEVEQKTEGKNLRSLSSPAGRFWFDPPTGNVKIDGKMEGKNKLTLHKIQYRFMKLLWESRDPQTFYSYLELAKDFEYGDLDEVSISKRLQSLVRDLKKKWSLPKKSDIFECKRGYRLNPTYR